jgi:hypothetical protein
MAFYQVYGNFTVEMVRGCVSLKTYVRGLKKYKSPGKTVEVTVNSKEENSFVCFVHEFGLRGPSCHLRFAWSSGAIGLAYRLGKMAKHL